MLNIIELFTEENLIKLLANGKAQAAQEEPGSLDFHPVIKLFTPDAQATWLLSEIDPNDRELAFGLTDMGDGNPALSRVWLPELLVARGGLNLPIERDFSFRPRYPISVYAQAARETWRITEDEEKLQAVDEALKKEKAEEMACEGEQSLN